MTDLLRQIKRNYRNRERVERLKRVSASFIRAAGASVTLGGLTFDVSPKIGVADSGDLENDLTELLVEVGRAAQDEGTGAVVLIDELQGAERLPAVVGACHRVNQERLPALVVGAGLPTVGKCSRTPSRTRSASSTCAVSDHSRATHRTRRSPNPLPT